mgnify:CR=1 FL=1
MGGHIIGRTGEFCDSEGGKEGRLSGTGVYPEIAEYERMSRQVVATRELLEEFVFDRKAAEVLIGEAEGRPVGLPLF